jgi:hypothetical protein
MRALWYFLTISVVAPALVQAEEASVDHIVIDARNLPGHWVRSSSGEGYETNRGKGSAALDGMRLPAGAPITEWLRMETERYKETGLAVGPCGSEPTLSSTIRSQCLVASGFDGNFRVLQCTYRVRDAPYFFSIEYRETSMSGDENAFLRRARQLQRAVVAQLRDLPK